MKRRIARLEREGGGREPRLILLMQHFDGSIHGEGRTWTEDEVRAVEADASVRLIVLEIVNEPAP